MSSRRLQPIEKAYLTRAHIRDRLQADYLKRPDYHGRLSKKYGTTTKLYPLPGKTQEDYRKWIQVLCEQIEVALTVTFTESALKGTGLDRRLGCEWAVKHLINRLNRAAFGHGVRRRGQRLTVVSVIEGEMFGKRLHAHVGLSRPPRFKQSDWISRILSEAQKCRQINREMRATAVTSAGWAAYLAKEGPSALALSCTQRGKA
jgi:hypothetical protein